MTSQVVQRDFSAGEVSPKLIMRDDVDLYRRGVLEMTNFLPTPQGTAVRTPGTRYLQEIPDLKARIVPYLTSANERSLLLFTTAGVKLLNDITDRLDPDIANLGGDPADGVQVVSVNIVRNPSFYRELDEWVAEPGPTPARGSGEEFLGVYMDEDLANTVHMSPRLYKYSEEPTVVTLEGSGTVQASTDFIILDYLVKYLRNPPQNLGGFTFNVVISKNSDYSSPVYDQTYTQADYGPESTFDPNYASVSVGAGYTGPLYYKLTATATTTSELQYSNPHFGVFYFRIYANKEVTIESNEVTTNYPYTAGADLQDLHYVQSPYNPKELIVTHPKHEVHRFWFDPAGAPAQYKFEPVPWSGNAIPGTWSANNYPATCTSYQGRLILAGSQSFKGTAGSPIGTNSETLWGTDPGEWTVFTASGTPVASDSIEIVTIYRSPIQWVYGQNTLFAGTTEYEYSIEADNLILAPDDSAAFLRSTHGSNNVQPAGFGEAVMFPADSGTKVRSLQYNKAVESWVAEDMTLTHPEVCYPGIVRMARMRNPHQMCLVLTKAGTISILHAESGLRGWSRVRLNNGHIRDICVVPDNNGRDVLFMTVERRINGVQKLYLEAIPNFSFDQDWDFVDSSLSFAFEVPTSTITGLDHLEGKMVHVSDRFRYVGAFPVSSGTVTLVDGTDTPINLSAAVVGLSHRSVMRTLPPYKTDPGASARFSKFSVRVLGSIRPIINGERPKDRSPLAPLNLSQGLDLLKDLEVRTTGWTVANSIQIEEHLPFRVEILGVFGDLKKGTL